MDTCYAETEQAAEGVSSSSNCNMARGKVHTKVESVHRGGQCTREWNVCTKVESVHQDHSTELLFSLCTCAEKM
eukprot:1156896-Pelagomonas_calceolata.AAC.14